MRVQYVCLFFILLVYVLSGCNNRAQESTDDTLQNVPTISNDYRGLADSAKQEVAFDSYFTDNPQIKNIERPSKSYIISDIDTALLFDIWVYDPNGPHADFVLDADYFDVADYDGDSRMPYILQQRNLIVFYNDGIQYGKVVSLTKDLLKIHWHNMVDTTNYVRWRN